MNRLHRGDNRFLPSNERQYFTPEFRLKLQTETGEKVGSFFFHFDVCPSIFVAGTALVRQSGSVVYTILLHGVTRSGEDREKRLADGQRCIKIAFGDGSVS